MMLAVTHPHNTGQLPGRNPVLVAGTASGLSAPSQLVDITPQVTVRLDQTASGLPVELLVRDEVPDSRTHASRALAQNQS